MDGRATLAMTGIFWVHPEQAAKHSPCQEKCKSLAYD